MQWRTEPDSVASNALRNDLFEPGERASNNEQHVGRINLKEFLLRMLAPALRRHCGNGAFKNLEQRLLYTFTGNVTSDGGVLGLAGNLVDFIDVDDSLFGALDIVIGGLNQFEKNVFDVFTDIAGFRQRGRVGNSKRNIEATGESLCEVRLAATGRADEKNVGLREFNLGVSLCGTNSVAGAHALVVVVDGNRERSLRGILPDDVFVEERRNLFRFRQIKLGNFLVGGGIGHSFVDNLVTQLDAFVANVDAGACNKLRNLFLGFPTEGTLQQISAVANSRHSSSSDTCSTLTLGNDGFGQVVENLFGVARSLGLWIYESFSASSRSASRQPLPLDYRLPRTPQSRAPFPRWVTPQRSLTVFLSPPTKSC